ncbi:hypothetical protein [uncultured Duncaniella sp.]|uniref:hypothetical protein n=1 Tax=uncultured Duncaniella sp. TaxID=2768039 RepID=UPI0025A9FFB1|nr:hypothetical protein [uncultured Duncaniella sp.]
MAIKVNARKVNVTAEIENGVIIADIVTSGDTYAGIENGNVFGLDGNQIASFYQTGGEFSLYFYSGADRPAIFAAIEGFVAEAMEAFPG